jgi:3-hydroxyisobutyrate dehydrogenase
MDKPRVAFLGLGIMGSGMANRLLTAGFPLSVYNRSAERSKPFAAAGAFVAISPKEAAARSEIVISMVADNIASRSVWLGENGALAGASSGQLLIDCSTLTVQWVRELAAAVAKHGCEFLDVPVTGTKPHAANGELLFLAGGSEKALERAKPVLAAMGRETIYFGPTGSGTLMKLINNFLCGVQAASLAEAMSLIVSSGIDVSKAFSVLTNGAPGSPMVKTLSSRAAAKDFTPNFELKLMAKDLSYADQLAQLGGGSGLPSAVAAQKVFEQAVAAGYGEKDVSAVLEFASQQVPSQEVV